MMTNSVLDLGPVSKELQLLLHCLRMHGSSTTIREEMVKNLDWKHFLQLAGHHRVYPIIYKSCKILANEGMVPHNVVKVLGAEYQRNTLRMLHLCGEMNTIGEHFELHHIRSIFLKGPQLAQELYGDISLRMSCDIDLLVEMKNLRRVERILKEQGYQKDDYFSTVLSDWKWRHHHITFFHPKKAIKVEVHWRLNPGPSKEPFFDELWERRRLSTVTGSSIHILGYEDLFLFLVTHGARHGWSRLRWLHDMDRMVQTKTLDTGLLGHLLRKYQYTHLGGQALILCQNLLHSPVQDSYTFMMSGIKSKRLAVQALYYVKQMINLHNEPLPEAVSDYHRRHLFALMSIQQKVWVILSFLHPYPEDAETLPLPRLLHFCYFPLRPFLWAWRKATRKYALTGRGN